MTASFGEVAAVILTGIDQNEQEQASLGSSAREAGQAADAANAAKESMDEVQHGQALAFNQLKTTVAQSRQAVEGADEVLGFVAAMAAGILDVRRSNASVFDNAETAEGHLINGKASAETSRTHILTGQQIAGQATTTYSRAMEGQPGNELVPRSLNHEALYPDCVTTVNASIEDLDTGRAGAALTMSNSATIAEGLAGLDVQIEDALMAANALVAKLVALKDAALAKMNDADTFAAATASNVENITALPGHLNDIHHNAELLATDSAGVVEVARQTIAGL